MLNRDWQSDKGLLDIPLAREKKFFKSSRCPTNINRDSQNLSNISWARGGVQNCKAWSDERWQKQLNFVRHLIGEDSE